jgi:AdoMet-dependent rRNA methyltransferase SPB1
MLITEEEKEKYVSLVKPPPFYEELMNDLKVLGKGDVSVLLKWRAKIRQVLDKKAPKQAKKSKASKEVGSDEELERELIQEQRREMKSLRKDKEREDDQLLLSKGVIGNEHQHDEEFGEGLDKVLQNNDLEELGYEEVSEDEKDISKPKMSWKDKQLLEEDLEEMYEQRKERIQHKTKQIEKVRAEKKKKPLNAEVSENKLRAGRINTKEQLAEQLMQNKLRTSKAKHIDTELKFSNPLTGDNESDIYISDEENDRNVDIEVDPNERVPGEREDDDAYIIHKPLSDMERRRKMLSRKKRKEDKVASTADKRESEIELVPAKKMEDYDIDSLAETLAVAKKMLRNRTREEILDASYSRYTFEDHDELPSWFTDDEKKHNYKSMPITKEEYLREKNRLLAINARAPKKVLEAKIRKRMKLNRKMKKVSQRAQKVLDQDGIDEYHKMKEVNKLYQRELSDNKDTKKYIVGKAWKGVGGKGGRSVKYVDSRLKKDKRATKRISKTAHKKRKNTKKARF